jgi:hypothetical protein
MGAFRFFQDENKVQNAAGNILIGVANQDDGSLPEQSIGVPWVIDPTMSWLDYRCWIECYLDSGMALHKALPQSPQPIDTLAGGFVGGTEEDALPKITTGVNLKSQGSFTDLAQRMATSRYTFVLKGYAVRAGYQIPVPGIKSVGGVPAIPGRNLANPNLPGQWSLGNPLVANYSGVPIFANRWELWYFVTLPPKYPQLPPDNLAQHIQADVKLPTLMTVAASQPDQNAVGAIVKGRVPVKPKGF